MFKKALMLRAEVPKDKERITFESLEKCDDMWTHLFCQLCENFYMKGEIWHYNGGPREVQYTKLVKERWIPNLVEEIKNYDSNYFDFIFARGGFQIYIPVLEKFTKSFKMYYGAGKRFFPIPPNIYNLVLVDSIEQKKLVEKKLPNQKVSLFIKPAADNIFTPVEDSIKMYDICVSFQMASYTKRFTLAMQSIVTGNLSALVIGYVSEDLKQNITFLYPKIKFVGRWFRKYLPEFYSRCKVGLAVHSTLESCPRVIPEFLACNLPIVVTRDTLFWRDKYINENTGIIVNPEPISIVEGFHKLEMSNKLQPRKYYEENLSLRKASKFLEMTIRNT